MRSVLIEFHPMAVPRREKSKAWTAYVCGLFTVFFLRYSIAERLARILHDNGGKP